MSIQEVGWYFHSYATVGRTKCALQNPLSASSIHNLTYTKEARVLQDISLYLTVKKPYKKAPYLPVI